MICRDGHHETSPEDVKWHSVCTGYEGIVIKNLRRAVPMSKLTPAHFIYFSCILNYTVLYTEAVVDEQRNVVCQ